MRKLPFTRTFTALLLVLVCGGGVAFAKETRGFKEYRYRFKPEKEIKIKLKANATMEMKFKTYDSSFRNRVKVLNHRSDAIHYMYSVKIIDKAGKVVAKSKMYTESVKPNDVKTDSYFINAKKKINKKSMRDILVEVLVAPRQKKRK